MASLSIVSTWTSPSASLYLQTGSSRTGFSILRVATTNDATRSGLLHCSFVSSSSSCMSLSSSFSGLSLGLNVSSNVGLRTEKRRGLVVTAAGKAALCLTKRNKSRKSLARTHGFRRRMKTTSGRAILKRRRAKGRKILCTKTNGNRGK